MSNLNSKWIGIYERMDAFWLHGGDPRQPHALLTSGLHSNGFCNNKVIIPDDSVMASAATDLVMLFARERVSEDDSFDGVVGPATGATKLAVFMAAMQQKHFKKDCFHASPVKSDHAGERTMVFSTSELVAIRGKSVLLCEDVITTGGSVERTVAAVKEAGGMALSFVCALVNRSGLRDIGGRKILSLIDREMPMWEPDDCPLCKRGSQAIRPKDPASNWALLKASH
ncbi:MAG TPA: phosphoribosyltransferase family protein [Candidatus Paceibacterota bacterium]